MGPCRVSQSGSRAGIPQVSPGIDHRMRPVAAAISIEHIRWACCALLHDDCPVVIQCCRRVDPCFHGHPIGQVQGCRAGDGNNIRGGSKYQRTAKLPRARPGWGSDRPVVAISRKIHHGAAAAFIESISSHQPICRIHHIDRRNNNLCQDDNCN
jgi:hypothetical protein